VNIDSITPLVLTFNEAPNIGRCLEALAWAKRVVVIDSFSSDQTLDILKTFPNVTVSQHRFDSFAAQCNFGLEQIDTPWVLSLDADYLIPNNLVEEISALEPEAGVSGFFARFTYCVYSRSLRESLYPPRTILYRRTNAKYVDIGHGHKVTLNGKILALRNCVLHDDWKPLDQWLSAQLRYARTEAELLNSKSFSQLNSPDRIRATILFAPVIVPLYTLLVKRAILDGWPGWYYTLQRTFFEICLSLRLLDLKLRKKQNPS
jgi:glycosyltransferase involved in cell wall biosynthesis